jgi:hypothetical protein
LFDLFVFHLTAGEWRRVAAEERVVEFECAIEITFVDEDLRAFSSRRQ